MRFFNSTQTSRSNRQRSTDHSGIPYRLAAELLENRYMLASVTTLLDVVDPNDGVTSLREAINGAVAGETIDFLVAGTIELNNELGQLEIRESLTIDGNQQITIDAGLGGDNLMNGNGIRAFNISDDDYLSRLDVHLRGLTITGGDVLGESGAAILSNENLTLSQSVITGNSVVQPSGRFGGGSLRSVDGELNLFQSRVEDNYGVGVFTLYGRLNLESSTVSSNSSDGVVSWRSHTTVSQSHIHGNGSSGIYNVEESRGSLEVDQSTISNNEGSAIFSACGCLSPGKGLTISNSVISGNSRSSQHAAVRTLRGGTLTLNNSHVTGNHRGGLSVGNKSDVGRYEPSIILNNSVVSNNTNSEGVGGVYSLRSLSLYGSTVSNNMGRVGGLRARVLRMVDSTVSDNVGTSSGGGVNAGLAVLSNSTVSSNETTGASGGGGVIAGSVTLINSTVSGNTATRGMGGGVSAFSVNAYNSTIVNNSAPEGGGIGGRSSQFPLEQLLLTDSIVAGNHADTAPDLSVVESGTFEANYSLITQDDLTFTGEGNIVGVLPDLLPLTDNGGPTQTHALEATSPAVNAGNSNPLDPPEFDQRGFRRIADGRMDIGAYEVQPLVGDFNDDGSLNCFDVNLLTSELAAGSNDPDFDLNGDGMVDPSDLDAWLVSAGEANFGPDRRILLGDANLDGVVDTADFNIWNSNKFTTNSEWCSGNFNGDAFVDVRDFALWNLNKFTSAVDLALPEQVVLPDSAIARSDAVMHHDEAERFQFPFSRHSQSKTWRGRHTAAMSSRLRAVDAMFGGDDTSVHEWLLWGF